MHLLTHERRQPSFLLKFHWLFFALLIPLLSSCASDRTIVNNLDEKEANEIIVLLSNKGIQAEKVKSADAGGGGAQQVVLWDVEVPEDNATQAMSILNNAGLPRRKSQNLLNIFSNTGLVPTDMAEKIRYQAGLASQIASTIRNIDGVLDADVIISYPEQDPLNPTAPKKDITASVYVKHSGVLDDPNSHLASKIKRLVASSVSGLKYDNVTLIPDRARFTEVPEGGFTRSEENDQLIKIWTISVAKDSVTKFRIIFFTFSILLLLFIILIIWVGWKAYPLIQSQGGLKELFNLKTIKAKPSAKRKKGAKEEGDGEEDEEEEEEASEEIDEEKESMADESADFGGEIDVSDEER